MSGWNRQTDRGGEIEGGGRLMERERAGWTEAMEGGWMRVMEVNGKGWTARCLDITHRGLRGAREEGGVCTPLRNLTKDADFLVAKVLFCNPLGTEETSRRWVVLSGRGKKSLPPSSTTAFG